MLLKSYRKEILRPRCNPSFQFLHCIARSDDGISEVLPYLNPVLGGFQYTSKPPSVTFKTCGKLITVHPREIAVNAMKDESEVDKVLEWLKEEINETWEKRGEIERRFQGAPKPRVIEVLRLLPKTNCREYGQPTCMVFAAQVAEGVNGPTRLPPTERRQQAETLALSRAVPARLVAFTLSMEGGVGHECKTRENKSPLPVHGEFLPEPDG
ncbi:MAG TPA: (Fe-S)-binding protein [Syntrophobacteraceae bacterium]|nr:(Fe-S)-binding protein [Syntrophobacteraceae bacterium]